MGSPRDYTTWHGVCLQQLTRGALQMDSGGLGPTNAYSLVDDV